MTLLENQLEAVKNELANIEHTTRCEYCNGQSLRKLYAEHKAQALIHFANHSAPEVLNISNSSAQMFGILRSQFGTDFANIAALYTVTEASPEFKAAYGVVQPFVDRIAEIEAAILEERRAHGLALQALADAEETARLKSEEKLKKDPAVLAAREAAEKAAPALVPSPEDYPIPFRGRVEVVPA